MADAHELGHQRRHHREERRFGRKDGADEDDQPPGGRGRSIHVALGAHRLNIDIFELSGAGSRNVAMSPGQGESMTTLKNRPNTALLVVDVQNGVVGGAHKRDEVVANVGSLVEKARDANVPVVWVQHSDEELTKGSDDWRIVPELAPGAELSR